MSGGLTRYGKGVLSTKNVWHIVIGLTARHETWPNGSTDDWVEAATECYPTGFAMADNMILHDQEEPPGLLCKRCERRYARRAVTTFEEPTDET